MTPNNRWFTAFAIFSALCIAYFGWKSASRQSMKPQPHSMANAPKIELQLTVELEEERPPYLGPHACAECHRDHYASFVGTKHPRTLREVVPTEMPDGFGEEKFRFQSPYENIRFELSTEAGRFFQTAYERTTSGEIANRSSMDLVLGAGGEADDVFLSWHDDGLMRELPMAWLYPSQQWAASHFDPNARGDFARLLTVRCIECHSTWVRHVSGTPNQYAREGRILGVTCESCHGPGGDHTEYHHQNPGVLDGKSIVKPAKLERERLIEVCTQCHSNAMKHRGPAYSYRPGETLDKHYKTILTSATEEDRVANQITYLRRSQCFQQDQSMTCVTCHNPHQPNTPANSGSSNCAKCHQPESCKDAPNLPAQVRGDCVSCHMPSYLKINVNFQTEDDNFVPPIRRTDHHIASNQHAREETLLNYFRAKSDAASLVQVKQLTQSLVEHYRQVAEQCRNEYRFLAVVAALREVVRIEDTPDAREQLQAAVKFQTELDMLFTTGLKHIMENNTRAGIASFESILAIKPNDAKAHGRLGTEYAKLGDRKLAAEHLEAVAKYDPNDAYGVAMLAWLAFLDNRNEEALKLYIQAEEIEPREAKMKYQIGLVLTRLGRLSDAIEKFQEALVIEPLHPNAIQAVVLALLETGRATEAIPYAERAVRATNSVNVHTLTMLGNVYQSANLNDKALQVYRLALQLAPAQDPSIIPRLRDALKPLEAVAK